MDFVRAWRPEAAARFSRADVLRVAFACLPDGPRFGAALLPNPSGFSPEQRLHSSKEFGRVFADPARSSDRFFTILGRPNTRQIPRLGLTISRRAAKRAVDRNKLKRLARESFRMQQSLPSWDFVVMAKTGADHTERRVLRESLDRHFARLKAQAAAASNG
jgi:ribonuclease P protein component